MLQIVIYNKTKEVNPVPYQNINIQKLRTIVINLE